MPTRPLRVSMSSLAALATGLLAFSMTACTSTPPEPASIENTKEISATVDAIDATKRMLTLRDDTGEKVTVEVDPAVRNLPQVKVGDKVVARYYEALAATLVKRGDGAGTTSAPVTDAAIGRAKPGEKPGVVMGTQSKQTVRITSVDKKNHVVSFFGSDGLARSIPIRTPQGQQFADKLKPGDEVEVTYTEALAITVEPAK